MPTQRSQFSLPKAFYGFGLALMTILVLSAGKPVLMPVALSILLAFVLSPLVQFLEDWKLGRIVSVSIASCAAFCFIGFAMWALFGQLNKLAVDLPNHEQEIRDKLASFQLQDDSTFGRLNSMLRNVFSGLENSIPREVDPLSVDSNIAPKSTVVIPREEPSQLVSAVDVLLPIVEPFATAAFVVVLVVFILIRREDIRYRTISLLGESALTGTTRLMQDTAERVSKYLFHLLIVNAVFGLWFAGGLYLLNVPYSPLWGFLTLFLRFIPFLGSPASLVFPLLISIATSTGWWQPLAVIVFFSISELVTANIIEPVLFGKSTGLTPIALLIAALFWAWLWGPIGLLLSTPMTVCLVVLGQHLPALRSLKVLLAAQPILEPKLQLFQRLLAKDLGEAEQLVVGQIASSSIETTVDDVILPALKWTRRERQSESITADEERFIYSSMIRLLDLPSFGRKATDSNAASANALESNSNQIASSLPLELSVVGYPVHHESEAVALAFIERLISLDCAFESLSTKLLPSQVLKQVRASVPDTVVLSVLPPGGLPQMQFMCSEIRAVCPTTKIVVAHFGTIKNYDRLLVRMRKIGVTYMTTSVSQTSQLLTVISEQKRDEAHNANFGTSSVVPSPHLERGLGLQTKISPKEEVTRVG